MSVDKYLLHYAEPEISALQHIAFANTYQQALVIPACDEQPAFIERVLATFQNTLLILIVNQSESAEPSIKQSNQALLNWLKNNLSLNDQKDTLTLYIKNNNAVLCVNRCQQPIPDKHGVGLARKIGCDIALQLIENKTISSQWIANTDADATLPTDYFEQLATQQGAAVVFNFKHRGDDSPLGTATALYEQHLHHYRNGLARAGSPYAFYALGSTIAVRAKHYAQVRGFPKRSGGEDFYLLNKLAKTGDIIFLKNCTVELEARLSHRVPFGTGPAVKTIMGLENPPLEYNSYNQKCFDELNILLNALPSFYNQNPFEKFSTPLQQALEKIHFNEGLAHSRKQSKNTEQFLKHLHQWLDGFKTLKLIHALRDIAYPNVPLNLSHSQP